MSVDGWVSVGLGVWRAGRSLLRPPLLEVVADSDPPRAVLRNVTIIARISNRSAATRANIEEVVIEVARGRGPPIVAGLVRGQIDLTPAPHSAGRLPGWLEPGATCISRFVVWGKDQNGYPVAGPDQWDPRWAHAVRVRVRANGRVFYSRGSRSRAFFRRLREECVEGVMDSVLDDAG